jgi:hypothetical protein
MSKVGGRKERKVKYLINKWIIQNKTIGRRRKVVAHLYCMVKVPHVELGYTRTH